MPSRCDDLALVGEVDRRQLQILQLDVAPDVQLGPVAQREDPDLLTLLDPAVVQRPRLRTLRSRIPLAELVAEAQNSLLGPGALLVATGAAECGIEAARLERVEQRAGLKAITGPCGAADLLHPPAVDGFLDGSDDELVAVLAEAAVAELDDLREIVPGIHVQNREGQRRGAKGLLRKPKQHDRVLAGRKEQDGPLQFGDDLSDDVHRLGLEESELLDLDVFTRLSRHHGLPPMLHLTNALTCQSLAVEYWRLHRAGRRGRVAITFSLNKTRFTVGSVV